VAGSQEVCLAVLLGGTWGVLGSAVVDWEEVEWGMVAAGLEGGTTAEGTWALVGWVALD
jgi:hypothetical protein